MNPKRWEKVAELFEVAVAEAPEKRAAFLDEACAGDDSLRREVEALLRSDGAGDEFDEIASGIATDWMTESGGHELIGQTLGHYRLLSLLGAGGMGEVYLAQDTTLDRKVALKLLPRQFTQDRDRLRRFEQEARAASALNHPNIITIYEIGESDGTRFMAAEYVEGETLREVIGRKNNSLGEVLEIGCQSASALAAAHEAGIVHRDIKPANIMRRKDGFIKVLDFGLAKLTSARAHLDVTEPGRVMGTINYMSPEQAMGQPLDHRTDIFSLGVVLYELATGRRLYEGKSEAAVYDAILHKPTPALREVMPNLPVGLEQVIHRALEKAPERRYQTAAEFRADLKRLAQGSGATAAAQIAARERWTARRSRILRVGSIAAVAAAIALGALWIWRGRTPPPAAPHESIAVLPFQNLSAEPENAYFVAGMQAEILTHLTKIRALKVISRTSSERYQSGSRNLREIAQQLGVANLLQGSVQRAGNAVQINVQLVRAATDENLWAETYSRRLDDMFGVQGEVTREIAKALDVTLTGAEAKALATQSTRNAAAYDAYLQGLAIETRSYDFAEQAKAADAYAEAVRYDPQFATAWARLAIVRSMLCFNAYEPAKNTPEVVREAADQAFALQPELGEAWIAQGIHRYRILRDFSGALRAYEEAQKRLPNSAQVYAQMAAVERRLGRWEAAEAHYRKAIELDPLNIDTLIAMGLEFLSPLRRYQEALAMLDRALKISPGDHGSIAAKAVVFQNTGQLAEAAAQLALIPEDARSEFVAFVRVLQSMFERDFERAIAQAGRYFGPFQEPLSGTAKEVLVFMGYCQEAVARPEEARATFARAIRAIKPSPNETVRVDSRMLPAFLALAYAGAGQKEKALVQAHQAVADYESDRLETPYVAAVLAQIQARFGEHGAALAALPHLLEVPAGTTAAQLRLHPLWDPLRSDPRFQQIIESAEQTGIGR